MIKTFNLLPYVGVDPIKFGEDRSEVRAILGDYKEYKKNKFSKTTLDDFGYCQVFYSEDDRVEAIEMYRNSDLQFDGVNLFSLEEDQLIALFNDSNVEKNEYFLTFPSIGVSVTLNERMPDSVLAYQKGYL